MQGQSYIPLRPCKHLTSTHSLSISLSQMDGSLKFLDILTKIYSDQFKTRTKRFYQRVVLLKGADGNAYSKDIDHTAPPDLGLHFLPKPVTLNF